MVRQSPLSCTKSGFGTFLHTETSFSPTRVQMTPFLHTTHNYRRLKADTGGFCRRAPSPREGVWGRGNVYGTESLRPRHETRKPGIGLAFNSVLCDYIDNYLTFLDALDKISAFNDWLYKQTSELIDHRGGR